MSKDTFYITTPIYYVNDKPHIGHSYTTILADVLARFHRRMGEDAWFLTGTDEHGQKVQRAAEKEGVTCQEQADQTVVRFQELWKKLEITNDDFIRTTEDRHKVIVQEILQDLYDKKEIYRAEYDGWYCVGCERFFTEKDLVDGNCPECGRPVEKIREANYFFRMGSYQEWLIQYIEEHPEFIQPDFRRNETLGFLRQPLQDLCISRPKSRLAWGIELPFDTDFVTYVWFDALVNYISAVGYRRDDKQFALRWPVDYHLIGKDILTTHTVYWPTMLKAMGLPMPKTVFAHGWWLSGKTKMSKSLGNVVNPMDMIDRYGVDAFRYFLIAEMTLGQDAAFTEEAFIKRFNSDLANDLGNALSRVLRMITKNGDGCIPPAPPNGPETEEEVQLWNEVQSAVDSMEDAVKTLRLDKGVAQALGAVRAVNRYMEQTQPWTLAKNNQHDELNRVLYTSVESLRVIAGLLSPIMPERMRVLLNALSAPDHQQFADLRKWGGLTPGSAVTTPDSLFPRIQQKKQKAPQPPKSKKKEVPRIDFDTFGQVDLRTAKVLEAERIEGADKLLKLQVDLGGETRQIVAGIAQHVAPEDLLGRVIIVVANLQPATIRGVESNGMLLAAADGKTLKLATVGDDCQPGARVR